MFSTNYQTATFNNTSHKFSISTADYYKGSNKGTTKAAKT